MSSVLCDAYTEVSCILDILGTKYKNEVPKEILDAIYNNRNSGYQFNINTNVNINKIDISREALAIISILNLKYWEKDVEKQKILKNFYCKNAEIYRDKAKKNEKNDLAEGKASVEVKKECEELGIKVKKSIWDCIKNVVRGIFDRLRRR